MQGKPHIPTLLGASDSSPDGHRRPADRDSDGRPISNPRANSTRDFHYNAVADRRANSYRDTHCCTIADRRTNSTRDARRNTIPDRASSIRDPDRNTVASGGRVLP